MSAGGVVVIIVPPPKRPKSSPLNQTNTVTIELEMIEDATPVEILHAAIAKLESEQE